MNFSFVESFAREPKSFFGDIMDAIQSNGCYSVCHVRHIYLNLAFLLLRESFLVHSLISLFMILSLHWERTRGKDIWLCSLHKQIKIFRFNKILFIGWHEIEILFLFILFSMWETINLFWIGARRKGFAEALFFIAANHEFSGNEHLYL